MIVAAYALFARALAQRAACGSSCTPRRSSRSPPAGSPSTSPATCQQLKFDGYYWGEHVVDELRRLPLVHRLPGARHPARARHACAGCIAIACVSIAGVCFAVRGPNLARVGVARHRAWRCCRTRRSSIWTASRYTYTAVAFFAPVAAIAAYGLYDRVRNTHSYVRIPATIVGLALRRRRRRALWLADLRARRMSGERTDRWALLVNELERNYDTVPPGTTIYIVDGPWTNPMEQYTWVPSVARALYGDAGAFDLPRAAFAADPPSTENALFLAWDGTGLEPLDDAQVQALLSGQEFVVAQ